MDTVPSKDEIKTRARTRLFAGLDPQTDKERSYVEWLASLMTTDELDLWSVIVERRVTASESLIGELRRLAWDRSLDDADRARRTRDAISDHDGLFSDPEDE
jgi:hypothetical protein